MSSNNRLPNLILIGGQGSGKGTQAEILAQKYGYKVIGMGQILRRHVSLGDSIGQKTQKILSRGELVPDEIVDAVLEEELKQIPQDMPLLFDGFPRILGQARALERLLTTTDRTMPIAVYLKIPRAVVFKRLAERRVCDRCGTIVSVPTDKLNDPCAKCRGQIGKRTDDRPEVIETRLNLFYSQTLPVIDFYKANRRLVEIDGEGKIEEVTIFIEKALGFNNVPHNN